MCFFIQCNDFVVMQGVVVFVCDLGIGIVGQWLCDWGGFGVGGVVCCVLGLWQWEGEFYVNSFIDGLKVWWWCCRCKYWSMDSWVGDYIYMIECIVECGFLYFDVWL